jgi:hypothetical protein
MTDDKDITLADIFTHLRGQTVKIDILQKDMENLTKEVKDGFKSVDKHFESIEQRLEHLEQDVFILIARKNDHEQRLHIIEKVQLPKIRKSIRSLSGKNREKKTPILQRTQ